MAKTLLQIRTKIRTYLDESAQSDWLDSEINTATNSAYQDVVGKVMEVYEGYYETTTPLTYALVANQQEYLISSTLLKVTRVEVNYDPTNTNSVPVRAVRVAIDESVLQLQNLSGSGAIASTGYFLHGSQDAQYIGFIPLPSKSDTGNTKSISVWGIVAPSDLVNDTDNALIPYVDRFYELIVQYAAAQLLRKGQQEESYAARYIQEYKVGVQEMQTYLKERQQDGVFMIEDVSGQDLDFETTTSW
jgi:hypothetical protein